MYKKAFTLVEVLLAMTVVGIVAVVTANSLGNISANKTKTAFQNNYKHLVQTVNEIVTDETLYPKIIDFDNVDETGRNERVSMCKYNTKLFPKSFLDLTNTVTNTAIIKSSITYGYSFDTTGGSYWVVKKRTEDNTCLSSGDTNLLTSADYTITFDVNGPTEGSNCPYSGSDLATSTAACSSPDTFKFGFSYNNKIIFDNATVYNGQNLKNYIDTQHFINSNN